MSGRGAAARQRHLQTPRLGVVLDMGVDGVDHADGAEFAALHGVTGGPVFGGVLAAVGGHQQHVRFPAGVHHRLRVLGIQAQGLFAQHMLAYLRGALHVLAVHGVGQHDVDGFHVVTLGQFLELVVGVHVVLGEVEGAGERFALVLLARDQRGNISMFAGAGRRNQLFGAELAEADDGVADALDFGFGFGNLRFEGAWPHGKEKRCGGGWKRFTRP